ncbi:hypothetical protein O3G_MSEX008768, partial [Manduca sexta]
MVLVILFIICVIWYIFNLVFRRRKKEI